MQVPEGWQLCTIGDVSKINTGAKDTQDREENGKYPFFVRSQTIERINSYSFDGEAILTAGDGVGVGKVFHYLNCKFDYHQRVYNIHNFSDYVSGRYVYQYFKQNFIRRVQKLSAKNSVDSVRMEMISKMPLPLPPLPEQKKIAEILSTCDECIENTEKQIAKLKDLKKATMQELLTKGIGHTEFKDSPLGRIPKSWEVVKLGEASKNLDGKRVPIKKGDRAEMQGQYRYYGASGVIDYVNDYIFDESLILIGEDGENLVSRNLPLAFKVIGKYWVNNHAHVIKPNSDFNIDYLTNYLESLDYTIYITGSAQPKLNQAELSKVKVLKPSLSEQGKIANILSSIDSNIENKEQKLSKLKDQKKALMNDLLTGKVRV